MLIKTTAFSLFCLILCLNFHVEAGGADGGDK